jgi:ketosteroid isomerase-like protein
MVQHIDADTSRTPEPAEVGPDNAALRALLAKLARAVTSGDGKAAAAIWATPALVIGDDMALTVASSADIQEVFGGAKAQYNARGITDTRPDILRLDWVTHRIAIVEVRWPYLAADGDEVGEETSTYIIRREPDGQLAIRAAVLHGEAATH